MSTETVRLIRDGEKGGGGMEVGGRRRLYTCRYTVTTRMTCIKMGSDESHFNVSVGSDGQNNKTVHKPQPFRREGRAKPRSFSLPA